MSLRKTGTLINYGTLLHSLVAYNYSNSINYVLNELQIKTATLTCRTVVVLSMCEGSRSL
ncbi:hypothetical protein T10_6836 [Trichinella papuae]|uniref:Uncharacterized protein n=1 Tax=Trichinella papuae TaxID=268474 RepID=A0A0V1MC65_9BILA|nr:hypothetical protein T10_6836 [Trichinella papuae]